MAKLNNLLLLKLSKRGAPLSLTDDECTGLNFNVTAPNAANWSYRYQVNRKRRELGLGGFPELGLAAAREQAGEARKLRRRGLDPLQVRKSEHSRTRAQAAKDLTVEQLWERFKEDKRKDWCWRSAISYSGFFNNYVFKPPLGIANVLVRDVNRDMIAQLLRPIRAEKPSTALHIQSLLTQLFDYAEFYNYGQREGTANPVRNIHKYLPPLEQRQHRRAMDYRQVPEFMAKLREFTYEPKWYRADIDRAAIIAARAVGIGLTRIARQFGIPRGTAQSICRSGKAHIIDYPMVVARALEVLILTGPPRAGEVIDTKWSEIDWDHEVLIMPRSRMKVKKGKGDHIIPLTKRVVEIFRELETIKCSDYVFPGRTVGRTQEIRERFAVERPGVLGFPMTREALSKFMHERMGYDVDVHGFRKTFKNWARNRGFDPELIELSLDHAYGSKIQRIYQDDQLVERRRELLNAWADYCDGSPVEIIRLPVHRRKAS